MKEFLNNWVWLDLLFYKDEFQEINKLYLVHPLDRKKFKSNTLYECIGSEGDYIILKKKTHTYRVQKEAVKQIMPNPKFNWNDKVIQISRPNIEASIDDFFWHHKNQKYFYHLTVNGKKKSNRYDETDLMKIEI